MPKKKVDRPKVTDSHEVKIPDAVKKQAEKADSLISGDGDSDSEPGDVIIDNPSQDPPPPKKEDKPVFTPVPDKEPVKKDSLPDDNVNWKHKYDVLQGMFNAKDSEVKALQQGMENLQTLVNHQAEQIRQINLSPPAGSAPPAMDPKSIDAAGIKKIDLDSVAGYGDEIVYMAEGFNALVELNKNLAAQLSNRGQGGSDPRLDRIESMVKDTAQERYAKALDAVVPKWREVVSSTEFRGWLSSIDPMSGYRYKDMMDYAYNNLRSNQAIAIIKAFGNSTGIDVGVSRQGSANPTQMVGDTNIVDQTRDPLAAHAMPDETTGGDQGQTPQSYPSADDVTKASAAYAQKRISLEQFNEISNRFQHGLMAAKKSQGR